MYRVFALNNLDNTVGNVTHTHKTDERKVIDCVSYEMTNDQKDCCFGRVVELQKKVDDKEWFPPMLFWCLGMETKE